MKKILFGIQVFAILLSLPAYIIVELNHKTSRIQENTEIMQANECPIVISQSGAFCPKLTTSVSDISLSAYNNHLIN